MVIARVLATLRANVRYCDVRYLTTERGCECGVAKDDFDGGEMVNESESGCGDDGVSRGGNVGGDVGGGGGGCEVRDASDARRSWVLVRESRDHDDRGAGRRRAHGRWIDGGAGDVDCDYWMEERGMCCRVGRVVEDERLRRQRQRLKWQRQCQVLALYRDAGDDDGELQALSLDRATCCDCANDGDDASQH